MEIRNPRQVVKKAISGQKSSPSQEYRREVQLDRDVVLRSVLARMRHLAYIVNRSTSDCKERLACDKHGHGTRRVWGGMKLSKA